MSTTGSLVVNLTANTAQFRSSLNQARNNLNEFSSGITSLAARATAAFAGIAGIGGGAAGLGLGVKLAADAEQARISFEVMLGSADSAKQTLASLVEFANSTPFEMPELRNAAKSLIAFGVSQQQLIPTMRSLGDISSGLGIPINELAQIYGKAKVQGRLFAEDINQLTGRGIPVIQEFAKQFGVTEDKVRKLVESGKIGFPNLEEAFRSMTSEGGKFFGMTEKQSQSLAGLFSTMKDSISMSLMHIGEVLVDKLDLKKVVQDVTQLASTLEGPLVSTISSVIEFMSNWGRVLGTVAAAIVAARVAVIAVTSAMKGYAIAQAIITAGMGPAGWAQLAAGAAAAALAIYGINSAFEGVETSAATVAEASGEFESIGGSFESSTEQASQFAGQIDNVTQQIRTMTSASAEAAGIVAKLGGEEAVGKLAKKVHDEAKSPLDKLLEQKDQLEGLSALGVASDEDVLAVWAKHLEEFDKAIGGPQSKIKELQEQIDTFGMTGPQKTLHKFQEEGKATAEQLEMIAAKAAELDQLEAGKKLKEETERKDKEALKKAEADRKKLEDDAQRMVDANKTPVQKAEDEIAKLKEFYDQGLITSAELVQGVQRNRDDLAGKQEREARMPEVSLAGSKEAFESIYRAISGGKADEAAIETAQNTADLVAKMDEFLDANRGLTKNESLALAEF